MVNMNMIVNTSDLVGYEAEKTASNTMLRKEALAKLLNKWGYTQAKNAKKLGTLGFLAVSLAACNSDDDDGAASDLASQLAAANAAVTAAQAAQAAAEAAQAAAETASAPAATAAAAAAANISALTVNIDAITADDASQTITSGVTGTTQHWQSFDVINMGGGTDTINAIVTTTVTPSLTDVEVVNVSATTNASQTIDMSGSTGYTTLNATGSSVATIFSNMAMGTDAQITNQGQNVTFGYAAATGATDSMNLQVQNVSAGTVTIAGIETVNITSTGGVANTVGTLTATSATAINISGTQAFTLTNAHTAATIDASGSTAAVTVTQSVAANGTSTYTGSSSIDTVTVGANAHTSVTVNTLAGNDRITISAGNALTTDVIDGGDGTDILTMTIADANQLDANTTALNISNIETLALSDDITGTVAMANIQAGLMGIDIRSGSGGAAGVTFPAGSATVALGDPLGGTLTLTDTGTATTDSVAISSSSTNSEDLYASSALTITGFENASLSTSVTGAVVTATPGAILMAPDTGGTATLTVTGSNKFDAQGVITADVINASGMTAQAGTALTFDMNAQAAVALGTSMSITGSAGIDLLRGDTDTANTIVGGDGNDTILGGSGNDTLSGDAGNDTITMNAGIDTITGGAGNDTLTAAANFWSSTTDADSFDGGDGTDTIVVTSAAVAAIDAYSIADANKLNAALTSVEVLNVTDTFNTGVALDMARLDGINHIDFDNSITGAESFTSLPSSFTVTSNAASAATGDILTLGLSVPTGATDTLVINLTGPAGNTDYGIIDADAFETITLNANEITATATQQDYTVGLTGTVSTNGTSLTIAGVEDVIIDTAIHAQTITHTGTGLLNMSLAAGSSLAQTITGGPLGDTLNGGGGADVISGAAGADTLNGGSGVDTITGGEGADTIDTGSGSDKIILTESTAAIDKVVMNYFGRGLDLDTIEGFGTANDEIQISMAAIETTNAAGPGNAAVATMVDGYANTGTAAVGNVVLGEYTAGAATLTINADVHVLVGATFGTTGDVEDAIEAGGSFAFASNANTGFNAQNSMLVVYSDGAHAYVAQAYMASETTNNNAIETGDSIVTNLVRIDGVSAIAATTFDVTSFEIIT
jgi:Ca2+-binding RTX toxin-like protein